MKKFLYMFYLYIGFVLSEPKEDQTLNVRNLCFKEIQVKDSTSMDSLSFFHKFDSLIRAYKIKAIYFVHHGFSGPSLWLPPGVIFINIDSRTPIMEKVTAELSHGEQFKRAPFRYCWKAVKGILGSLWSSVFYWKHYNKEAIKLAHETGQSIFKARLWIAYKETQYKDPESFEYNAHIIVEPSIRKILWGLPKEVQIEPKKNTIALRKTGL